MTAKKKSRTQMSSVYIKMPKSAKDLVDEYAKKENVSINKWLRDAVRERVARELFALEQSDTSTTVEKLKKPHGLSLEFLVPGFCWAPTGIVFTRLPNPWMVDILNTIMNANKTTVAFCSDCGAAYKAPEQKFCMRCGAPGPGASASKNDAAEIPFTRFRLVDENGDEQPWPETAKPPVWNPAETKENGVGDGEEE